MDEKNESLQETTQDVTMQASTDDATVAGNESPEDTADDNALQGIINRQGADIEALTAENERLHAQITRLIANGAQIRDDAAKTQQQQPQQIRSLTEDYVSLADLGKQIGK